MNLQSILAHCDHTLLNPCATWEEIHALCDEGMKYRTASVCIPPSYVRQAKEYVKNALPICTVIGFPNGYCTTEVKCFEAAQAVENGADEIDMVINLGFVKEGRFDRVLEEIRQMKAACSGRILKVIIETCFLTEEEIIALCKVVTQSGADYIKTSTGFGSAGAKPRDIELFRENIGPNIKIKAAGGIASLEDAARFLEMGASRLGTSRIVKLAKKLEQED